MNKYTTAETSFAIKQAVMFANGRIPAKFNPNAYVYYTAQHYVPFLDYACEKYRNNFTRIDNQQHYVCAWEGESCEKEFENVVTKNLTKMLLFMKNVRGDKKYRFMGEYVLEVESSRAAKKWIWRRLDVSEAVAEPFVAYKINGHIVDFQQ